MYCSKYFVCQIPPGIYDEHGKSMNKGCIYICESSPPTITLAYAQQFREDFSRFLRLRSQEITKGGRMVLVFLGRECCDHIDRGNSFLWQLLARSFAILVSKVVKYTLFYVKLNYIYFSYFLLLATFANDT